MSIAVNPPDLPNSGAAGPGPAVAVARDPEDGGRSLLWGARAIPLPGSAPEPSHRAKRAVDLCVSVLTLVALAPLLVLICAAIALTSRGPVIFRQERWGSRRRVNPDGSVAWEARVFTCLKFRTMTSRADEAMHARHVEAFVRGELEEARPESFKMEDDPRITRVGAVLRATSLDELPQLVNVIRGEMSIVGPRPVPLYEVDSYPGDWCLVRLGALPGITGLWQVRGRSVVTFEEMIQMDVEYVTNPSLGRDLRLLVQTIPSVFTRRGAG